MSLEIKKQPFIHSTLFTFGSFFVFWRVENVSYYFQVMELYHALALRFFLLGTHYRTTISYSNEQLDTASDRLFYIYQVGN